VVAYVAHPRVHEKRLHPLVDTCNVSWHPKIPFSCVVRSAAMSIPVSAACFTGGGLVWRQ